jgi:hypothetical protein
VETSKVKKATKRELIVVATMISRMMGTPVFSDRTEYSVTTGASIVEREGLLLLPASLQDPDSFVQRRFAIQSEVISWLKHTAALAIATVRDDMDRVLAVPYFTIDHHLLRRVTEGN